MYNNRIERFKVIHLNTIATRANRNGTNYHCSPLMFLVRFLCPHARLYLHNWDEKIVKLCYLLPYRWTIHRFSSFWCFARIPEIVSVNFPLLEHFRCDVSRVSLTKQFRIYDGSLCDDNCTRIDTFICILFMRIFWWLQFLSLENNTPCIRWKSLALMMINVASLSFISSWRVHGACQK